MKRSGNGKNTLIDSPPPSSSRWFNGFFATLPYCWPAAPSAGRCGHRHEDGRRAARVLNPSRRSGWTTVNPSLAAGDRTIAAHRRLRKGGFFNYVMVYMTVSAALMTTAGLCLHAILKADSSERRESLFLSALQRAEHQLRTDSRHSGVTCESPTSILCQTSEETRARWTSDRGILTRTESRLDEIMGSDRFIFPAGSQIQFEQRPDNSAIVRITEPSVFVTYSTMASGGSNLHKPAEEAIPATPTHVAQPNIAEIRLRGVPQ